MNTTCLAISIGNTRMRVGAFVEGKLTADKAIDNVDLAAAADALTTLAAPVFAADGPVVISTVCPSVADEVEALVKQTLGAKIWRIERDLSIPIGRQLDPESIVGEDRLLNAAAAYSEIKQACIIVDAGTALTVDFVDGAGTFHGGAIAPGARMMLQALQRHTAQLPEVELRPPAEPIGHSTVEAMRTAAFHGLRGMVRELVEKFAESVGQYPLIIATGGDAEMLFKDYDLIERIVPDLTLRGLAVTVAAHMQKPTET